MRAHTGHIHYILVAFLDEPLLAIGSIDFISLFLMVVCSYMNISSFRVFKTA